MIKVNAVQCPKCKVIIYSRAHHDYHECNCGACAIDGGSEYLRMAWDQEVGRPDPFVLEVNADKGQLYHDWNNRENKFGWVYPKIENKRKEKRNRKKKP